MQQRRGCKEECAEGMVQMQRSNYVSEKGAQTMPSVEDFVLGMGRIDESRVEIEMNMALLKFKPTLRHTSRFSVRKEQER